MSKSDKTIRPTPIGCVIIHWKGTNPYVFTRESGCVGESRVLILKEFHSTGVLPQDIELWDDRNKKPITSPDEIDWSWLD